MSLVHLESIVVNVKDNDAPSAARPEVSISGPNYVAEGDTISFTLTASESPNNNVRCQCFV